MHLGICLLSDAVYMMKHTVSDDRICHSSCGTNMYRPILSVIINNVLPLRNPQQGCWDMSINPFSVFLVKLLK